MIEVCQLTKSFNGHLVVDKISFTIPEGQVLGFLGPNGAGKTTTMKMVVGSLFPTSGTVRIHGQDIVNQTTEAQKLIGYLPESATSYAEMTVAEFLDFMAEVRALYSAKKVAALERVKELCFLSDVWHQPIETLSKGYRQRVGFAQALIHDPPVLILDEPTDGLDPNQKHEVRRLIKKMGRSKTIILSTHILEEVESVCSRLVIISGGKLVADSTPQELIKKSKFHNSANISVSNKSVEEVTKILSKVSSIESLDQDESGSIRIFPTKQKQIVQEITQLAELHSWKFNEFNVDKGRLDDVFRSLTSEAEGA